MRKWGAGLALALLLAGAALGAWQPFRREARMAGGGRSGRLIWIELDRKRLTVYENGAEAAVFPIASGARDTPSPVGVYRITHRFETALSGFGTRFLGLNVAFGQYGIHGTNMPGSIGRSVSHGCIRLRIGDAEKLYRMAGTGTPVVIEGGPYGAVSAGLRPLREGDRGSDVALLQRRLIQRGLLDGSADGVFGAATRRAVLAACRACGLPESDVASYALQRRLGIICFE